MPRGRIPLKELASLPSFAAVTPSWGRDRVAFYWDRTGRWELYTLDLASRELRQVTDGQAPRAIRAGFVWTRDDREIIFARDRDGDEQNNLFKIDVRSSDLVQLNDDPTTQEYAGDVHPSNDRMAVTSNRGGQMNVYTLDLRRETHEWKQLTNFRAPAFAGAWSPDGRWLAVGSNESENLKNQDAYLVRDDASETRKVLSVRDGSQDAISDWHPDGRRVSVTSDAGGAARAGILDLDTLEVRWLGSGGDDVEEYAGEFSASGEWLAVIRNRDSAIMPVLYRVSTGEARELKLPSGVASGGFFVLNDSKLVVMHAASNRRPELVLYDLHTDTFEALVPAEYGSIDPSVFVTDEYVRYPSFDGQTVPAILYRPRDAAPGEKRPAVIVVHGGPTAQFFRGFDAYAQFLVDRGYVVLEPNVRGSTGYGTRWRDANLRDWGGGDLEDVAAGAEFLRSLPEVDPERIGVFGGSYGGYMSFMAATKKPDAFKVSVPWVGISDLHRLYDEDMEHFKYYLRQQMGDPEENRALWRDRSAIEFADRVKAKMLIVHGLNDPRCPITQARAFRDRLLELGKTEGTAPGADFEYHEFGDEGHGAGDIQGKIRTYELLADFLDRRL